MQRARDPERRARPDVDCGATRPPGHAAGVRNASGKSNRKIHQPFLRAHRGSIADLSMKRLAPPANLAIFGGLFALNVALNVPLFETGEMPYRGSIEGGYAAM